MTRFKKRSLTRYGLALLVVAGAALLAGTSPSGASDGEVLPDQDCWLSGTRICNLTYYSQCWQQPDGTSCFRCPFTFIGAANCVVRPGYACQRTDDLPFDCGPKNIGICVAGNCFGAVVIPDLCKLLQCTNVSS